MLCALENLKICVCSRMCPYPNTGKIYLKDHAVWSQGCIPVFRDVHEALVPLFKLENGSHDV